MDPSAADALLRLGLIIAFVVMWAILAGLLARWKNRQRSIWIVMSFLFGPFALLILLLLPRKPLPGMKAVECPGCPPRGPESRQLEDAELYWSRSGLGKKHRTDQS